MQPFNQNPTAFRFGTFEVDVGAGEIRKHGLKVGLSGQPFLVLVFMLEKAGDVVTRQELEEKLWPDTTVDYDHSLNVAINKIRGVLGDSAESPRFVETLPRHGYRFIAPVTPVFATVPATVSSPGDGEMPQRNLTAGIDQLEEQEVSLVPEVHGPRTQKFPWRYGFATLGALAVLASSLVVLVPGGLRERIFGLFASQRIDSIAVLPFQNLSGEADQEYFADGFTDALTTDLAQVRALRVISRTSAMGYKGTKKPLPQIARELNVDAVVEGTVLRSGDRVRITVSLLHAATDRHIWSKTYEEDLPDILGVQREMALTIVDEVRVQLPPPLEERFRRVPSVDPDAYLAYLKGRFWWNKRTEEGFSKAVEYFQKAIEKDPNYGQAYAGLADAYLMPATRGLVSPREAYPKARALLTKALALDDSLAEAHNSLAYVIKNADWDWAGAEREFQRAIALNPGYTLAHQWYAHLLSIEGRRREALAEAERAQELDPLSPTVNRDLGAILYRARDYDKAITQLRNTLEIAPSFPLAYITLSNVYAEKGMYPEAIAERKKAVALSSDDPELLAGFGRIYALEGNIPESRKLLDTLAKRSKHQYVPPLAFVSIYIGLGDKDSAFSWLERAYEERSDDLGRLRVDPLFDSLRSDPRFQELIRRIGVPQQ